MRQSLLVLQFRLIVAFDRRVFRRHFAAARRLTRVLRVIARTLADYLLLLLCPEFGDG